MFLFETCEWVNITALWNLTGSYSLTFWGHTDSFFRLEDLFTFKANKMCSSELSANSCLTIGRHIPQDSNLYVARLQNPKYNVLMDHADE